MNELPGRAAGCPCGDLRNHGPHDGPLPVSSEVERAVEVLAEMERHAPLPNPVGFYALKLREALGVEGALACQCGACLLERDIET